MVADALIYHPAVSHYNKFVATTLGRDKTLRTIQYFSRFLAWYTYRTNHAQSTVAIFDAIKKNFGSVRKCMRLGKFVEHVKAAAVASDSTSLEPVLKWLAVGRQVGYAFYMGFDMLTYPDSAGIRKFSAAARLQKEAYRAWLVGLSCNILAGVYTLWKLRVEGKRLQGSGSGNGRVLQGEKEGVEAGEIAVEKKKIVREQTAAQLQLLSDVCDFTVPSSALGYLNFDDGIVGLAGTTSSLIGLYAAWAKTA